MVVALRGQVQRLLALKLECRESCSVSSSSADRALAPGHQARLSQQERRVLQHVDDRAGQYAAEI